MNKELIKKILENKLQTLSELNEFVSEYVKMETGSYPTDKELLGIVQLIQQGFFSLEYASTQAAIKENINVTKLYNKDGIFIKTYIN